jgi:RND family efflux transporter MFP subunit
MKKLLPLVILLGALILFVLLLVFKPDANEVTPERPVTSVEIITAQPETVTLTVRSQGTLLPRTESDLSAEVSGRIIHVSDAFQAGGYIRKNDRLLEIDPADYFAAVTAQAAELANAELALAQETALAEQATADWTALGEGKASDLTLRKPQLALAKARISAAKAALDRAERDLARTKILAPYDGRVLETMVDLGQFVIGNPGNPVARVFATDQAEIRLPISTREAEFLETRDRRQRFVQLRKANTPDSPVWTARFARIEATVNPKSRLLYVVAALDNPFEPSATHLETLRRGQFMNAEIEGRTVSEVYRLPRFALRGSNTVYVVTDEKTLITRKVEILKSDTESVIISSGIGAGERVAVSPIAYFVENMPVDLITKE